MIALQGENGSWTELDTPQSKIYSVEQIRSIVKQNRNSVETLRTSANHFTVSSNYIENQWRHLRAPRG